jgi:low affinity Fe/Cu permease
MSAPNRTFARIAKATSRATGRPSTFLLALTVIVVWAVTGPLFHYSDTWQLVINTGTTVVTFLMVFLIQNTQNRDTAAIQLKLDELIRANEKARNKMLRLEDLTEEELKTLKANFVELAGPAKGAIESVRQAKDELEDTEDALEQFSSRLSDAARG